MPSPEPALSDTVRRFLAGTNVASVASLDDDGAPRQTVVWYRFEADGRILLNGRTPRRWCANVLREPRVALSIIDGADPYRWIGLTGVVDEVVDELEQARDDIVALAHRYHPEGVSASTVADFRSQPRVSFRVRITGVHDHHED